jgi:hypothetical protein
MIISYRDLENLEELSKKKKEFENNEALCSNHFKILSETVKELLKNENLFSSDVKF